MGGEKAIATLKYAPWFMAGARAFLRIITIPAGLFDAAAQKSQIATDFKFLKPASTA
jgi:hypothetical protein